MSLNTSSQSSYSPSTWDQVRKGFMQDPPVQSTKITCMWGLTLRRMDTWTHAWGPHGSHLEAREINSAWIRPLPLGSSVSDLIVQHVVDQVAQDAVQSSEPELEAVSLDRAAIVEAQLEISHVQYPTESFIASHRAWNGQNPTTAKGVHCSEITRSVSVIWEIHSVNQLCVRRRYRGSADATTFVLQPTIFWFVISMF